MSTKEAMQQVLKERDIAIAALRVARDAIEELSKALEHVLGEQSERAHPEWPANPGVEIGCEDRTCTTCYRPL